MGRWYSTSVDGELESSWINCRFKPLLSREQSLSLGVFLWRRPGGAMYERLVIACRSVAPLGGWLTRVAFFGPTSTFVERITTLHRERLVLIG